MKKNKKKISSKNTAASKSDAMILSENREDEIINTMANTSIILTSMLMGAFTLMMVSVTNSMTSGIVEALGGKEPGDVIKGETKPDRSELDEKTKTIISDMKKDIYLQMSQKKQEMKQLLSDPVFDVGPRIISKYDFKLPKLTEELDDETLMNYAKLLVDEDPRFAKMFKALTEWLSTLPKPPETNQQK